MHENLVRIKAVANILKGLDQPYVFVGGATNAIPYKLDNETEIRIFSLPYFLASKWEAHKSRGANDLRTSRDFEDMVYVFENCRDFDEQLLTGPDPVREYLTQELSAFLEHPDFEEALYCHMESARYGASVGKLIAKIKASLMLREA